MTHENSKPNSLTEFLTKNLWAIALVISSVIAQWAVFGVRLDNIEARQDRQDATISTLQDQIKSSEKAYSSLEAKVEALNDNVLYIRNRIDRVLSN